MTDRDHKKAELRALLPAAKKPRTPSARPAAASHTIIVNGAGLAAHQIVAGDVHHIYSAPPRRPRIVVQPGHGVIDEDQKAAITALRAEWLALHSAIKKKPLTDAAAWVKINRAAGVTSYHLIPPERFDQVLAYIKGEMAKLRNMRSAPGNDAGWRAARIGAIKARCNNQLADPEAYRQYIRKNFKAESLADLATDQLQRTYTYIMGKKLPL